MKRELGSSGMAVSAIGLGCMGMSSSYDTADEGEAAATIRHALELGVDLFDTADVYGAGHNEELLARALGGERQGIRIATKVGNVIQDGVLAVDGRPEHVVAGCEASLRRLNTEVIDLYYLHRVDPATPIEETVGAMARLVEAGKVRAIGLSEAAAATIRKAHAVHPIAAVQSEYSLWSRDQESEVLPLCEELNIAFVAYSPIGRGFLSGRFRELNQLSGSDRRRNFPRFSEDNWKANLALLEQLENLAETKRATPAQVALAWVLDQSPVALAIPGTKHRRYLKENVAALSVELSDEEREALNRAFPPGIAAGERFPPDQMKRVGL